MKKTTKTKQIVNGCTPYFFTIRQEGQSKKKTKQTNKKNKSLLKSKNQ